ncbi:DUF6252 family protein [Luteirhabdus pelagi]|uniref:DUF6252 family protein n=1 Tax=Luteirhabdus pelagi TaxID=2792783 RepID=UPI00193A3794|nr:DUF6252 family protein [Luteirhabdus pelagi]
MKKIARLFYLVLAAFSVICCTEDDSGPTVAQQGEMVAMINGENFSSSATTTSASLSQTRFTITALDEDTGRRISISVHAVAEGTYELGLDNSVNGRATLTVNDSDPFESDVYGGSGKLTITDLDLENKTVTGLFRFVAIREDLNNQGITEIIEVTDGSFSQVSLGLELFKSVIDGTPFNADVVHRNIQDPYVYFNSFFSMGGEEMDFGMSFPQDISEGTYNFGNSENGIGVGIHILDLDEGDYQSFSPVSGTLTITNNNLQERIIEGFFNTILEIDNGELDTTIAITNGTFTIQLGNNSSNSLSMEINGNSLTVVPIARIYFREGSAIYHFVPAIINNNGNPNFSIRFPVSISEGTYNFGAPGSELQGYVSAIYTPGSYEDESYRAISGTFIITNYDAVNGIIEGTFNFIGQYGDPTNEDTVEITDGSFSLSLE